MLFSMLSVFLKYIDKALVYKHNFGKDKYILQKIITYLTNKEGYLTVPSGTYTVLFMFYSLF
jgi:hypothetical protein